MNTFRRILTGAALLAAVPALAVGTSSTARADSGDTPDGYSRYVFDGWAANGSVTWNDYDNEFHHKDYDNFWLNDEDWDNESVQLRVYWGGKTHKIHAHDGNVVKLDIGNVPDNAKVYFRVCDYNNGHEDHCTGKHYFKE